MGIPRLSTARLDLRGFEERDFDAYASMMIDPIVTRYLGDGQPLSRADAWRQMAMFAGHWLLRGFGVWAVEERESGAFIGRIGCFQPEGWPGLELAYTLARPFWGHGYAREGAGAALEYAREVLGCERIISIVRRENAPSIRLARSLGAEFVETIQFFGSPADLYQYPPRMEMHS